MKKITNIVLLALIVIAVVTVALWMFGGTPGGMDANVEPMLYATYAFFGIAVALLLGMTAMNMGKTRGNSKLGLYVFGGLVVLGVIFWFAMARDTPVVGADGTVFDNAFELKATETGLYLTYVALAVTVLALLWGVVRKALK